MVIIIGMSCQWNFLDCARAKACLVAQGLPHPILSLSVAMVVITSTLVLVE
jgi:hypothetical protein